ncbi:MAG: hypothetical protein KJI71_05095, partial [Patescibacteria group bacterium]|nr:hypothetical protein [Patescibacteria group bacterium]
ESIRCILNARENISELVNGSKFVFYKKKSNQFLNLEDQDLAFEEFLITSSGTVEVLQDTIQKIKLISSRIFAEINEDPSLGSLPQILKDFDKKYWNRILEFTSNYFDIEIPSTTFSEVAESSTHMTESKEKLKDYSDEYTILVSTNKNIGKEFIQLLHDYRSKRVNPSHLVLEQLFNPQELYNYLRNHHWSEGIPESFVKEWSEMNLSQYKLTEQDQVDFEDILKHLGLKLEVFEAQETKMTPYKQLLAKRKVVNPPLSSPSLGEDWVEFQQWIVNHIEELEQFSEKVSQLTPKKISGTTLIISNKFSQKIQGIFKTAESLFEIYRNDLSITDASLVIAEYGKGLETILHEKISPVFSEVIKKYRTKFKAKKTSVEFDKKFGNLMTSKSINLGMWVSIIEKCGRVQKSEESREFYRWLNSHFDITVLNAIKKAYVFLSPWRNKSVHNNILGLEKVVPLRERTVQLVNPVIAALYGEIRNNSHIPPITDFSQYKVWLLHNLDEINKLIKTKLSV